MEEYLEQVRQRHTDPIRETEARKILEGKANDQQCYFCISTTKSSDVLIVIEDHSKEFPHNKTISANQLSPWLVTGYRQNQMPNIQAVGGICAFSVYDWNENGWKGPLDVVAKQQGQQVVSATEDQTVLVDLGDRTMKIEVTAGSGITYMSHIFTIESS